MISLEEKDNPTGKEEEEKKISDKALVFITIGIILIGAAIFGVRFLIKGNIPKTIEDLHKLNIEGKLDESQGYIYNGYSFVKFDNMWHTKMMSPMRTREYNIYFRYGPKEAKDVPVYGTFNLSIFNNAKTYYVTFNPVSDGLQYVALAANDFNQQMVNIFFKTPIPACDRNETEACASVPIITCDNTNDIVLYIVKANETSVNFQNNCIIVEGTDFELVRAIDKVLYTFYGIA